jgi:hypothetical protein
VSEGFSAEWLALREGFDAAARNVVLANRLAAVLPAQPRLLDLGAGTGSLLRWLAPLIGQAQHWTLADADAGLLARALEEIAGWAEARGHGVTADRHGLALATPGGVWRVAVRVVDLARDVPLDGHDAVVCSALLDLVSASWVEGLADRLRAPLLAALSVDGRDTFLPAHEGDAVVRAGFRHDQLRDKGLGPALGARAPAAVRRALAARGFRVTSAASDWRIPPAAGAMLAALVEGHAEAALRQMPRHADAIADWRAARLRQAADRRLAIRIGHRDSLALPPPG